MFWESEKPLFRLEKDKWWIRGSRTQKTGWNACKTRENATRPQPAWSQELTSNWEYHCLKTGEKTPKGQLVHIGNCCCYSDGATHDLKCWPAPSAYMCRGYLWQKIWRILPGIFLGIFPQTWGGKSVDKNKNPRKIRQLKKKNPRKIRSAKNRPYFKRFSAELSVSATVLCNNSPPIKPRHVLHYWRWGGCQSVRGRFSLQQWCYRWRINPDKDSLTPVYAM